MLETVTSWLVLLTPLALAICATALAWRKVKKPFLFLCVAVFALLAIQAIVLFLIAGRLPPGEPNSAYLQVGGLATALVVVLGGPLLWCLYRGLRHAGKPAAPNSTPHSDARASAELDQLPSARAGERGR